MVAQVTGVDGGSQAVPLDALQLRFVRKLRPIADWGLAMEAISRCRWILKNSPRVAGIFCSW
jgi:hypothetical protein